MPVYEYQCKACHHEFEYQQRMSDPDKTTCDDCGGALERLISRTAFQLKGGGWYKDLYASAKPGADTKATPSSGDGASTPAAAAPAAAPAAKSDTGGSSGGSSSGGSSSGGSSSGGSSGGTTSSSSGSSGSSTAAAKSGS